MQHEIAILIRAEINITGFVCSEPVAHHDAARFSGRAVNLRADRAVAGSHLAHEMQRIVNIPLIDIIIVALAQACSIDSR